LRFILRHCGVRKSTPHFSGLTRLACGLFYEAVSPILPQGEGKEIFRSPLPGE
jgi:hypothetical protein